MLLIAVLFFVVEIICFVAELPPPRFPPSITLIRLHYPQVVSIMGGTYGG